MFGRRYGAAVRVTGSATLHCGRGGMRAGGDMPDRPDKLNRQLSAGNPADTIAVDLRLFYAIAVNMSLFS